MNEPVPPAGPQPTERGRAERALAPLTVDAWFRLGILALLGAALLIGHDYLSHQKAVADRQALAAEQRYASQTAREQKAYVAKRRNDCYDIYARERARYTNVQGLDYDEEADRCEVIYRGTTSRSSGLCASVNRDTSIAWLTSGTRYIRNLHLDCADNNFRNQF